MIDAVAQSRTKTDLSPVMTEEEFVACHRDEDVKAEFVDGRVIVVPPESRRDEAIRWFVGTVLRIFAEHHHLGELIFLLLLPSGPLYGGPIVLQPGTVVRFATVEEGEKILTTHDDFVAAMSPFDREARMKTDQEVPVSTFLKFLSQQVRPWRDHEVQNLEKILSAIQKKLVSYRLSLPSEILLVKTSGAEEGGALYCRGNAIVFPQEKLDQPAGQLENIVIHELFHILTRNDPRLRASLYEIVHFHSCPELEFPAELADRKITNPDAPHHNSCIEVTLEGKPATVIPILFSRTRKYDPLKQGRFFDSLEAKLLPVEPREGKSVPRRSDGKLWLLNLNVPDYLEKIGKNTRYIFHPEEILADNFVLLVQQKKDVPSAWILEKLRKLLEKETAGDSQQAAH